jgi:hypothetical protein
MPYWHTRAPCAVWQVVSDYERMLRDATGRARDVCVHAAAQLLALEPRDSTRPPAISERLSNLFVQPAPSSARSATSRRAASARRRAEPADADVPAAAASAVVRVVTPLIIFNPLPFRRCEAVELRVADRDAVLMDERGRAPPDGIGLLLPERSAGGSGDALPPATPLWSKVCVPPLGLVTRLVHASAASSAAEAAGATAEAGAAGGTAAHADDGASVSDTSAAPPRFWGGPLGGTAPSTVRLVGGSVSADVDGASGMLKRLHVTDSEDGTSARRPQQQRTVGARLEVLACAWTATEHDRTRRHPHLTLTSPHLTSPHLISSRTPCLTRHATPVHVFAFV